MDAGSAAPDTGYEGAAVAGAALATVFFPFFALVAALLLQGGQSDPRKKSQLRSWAWWSGGLLVLELVVFLVLQSVTL